MQEIAYHEEIPHNVAIFAWPIADWAHRLIKVYIASSGKSPCIELTLAFMVGEIIYHLTVRHHDI